MSSPRKRILVRSEDQSLNELIRDLSKHELFSLDTETTGLNWSGTDRLFSIQIAFEHSSYYLNFGSFPHYPISCPVLDKSIIKQLQPFLEDGRTMVGHNINFDAHMLEADGLEVRCSLEDTLTRAQVLFNKHDKYSLDACSERVGLKKDDIMSWIEENSAYKTWVDEFNGSTIKDPDFTLVPWEMITEYGFTDVEVTYDLYKIQEAALANLYPEIKKIGQEPITLQIESKVSNVIIAMERDGMRIDRDYSKLGMQYESHKCNNLTDEFKRLTGTDFVDSVPGIGEVLKASGVELGTTKKGEPSIASWVLEKHPENELVKIILEYRDRYKRGNTYFANFLRYSNEDGFLHASFKSRGAYETGRMSGSKPNMQNITSGENCEYPIRKALLARENCALVELDYRQQEFRLTLDYSRDMDIISSILNGIDPHQALAELLSIDREPAKAIQFGLLYGMGIARLAAALKCSIEEAKLQKARFFKRLPGMKNLTYAAQNKARDMGYVTSWDGCRFYFPDPNDSYMAMNRIIQGGCAAITKQAMYSTHTLLTSLGLKSKLLFPIHDSLLFDIHRDEFPVIEPLRTCMVKAYPHKLIGMDTSVKHSFSNLHEMVKGLPNG